MCDVHYCALSCPYHVIRLHFFHSPSACYLAMHARTDSSSCDHTRLVSWYGPTGKKQPLKKVRKTEAHFFVTR